MSTDPSKADLNCDAAIWLAFNLSEKIVHCAIVGVAVSPDAPDSVGNDLDFDLHLLDVGKLAFRLRPAVYLMNSKGTLERSVRLGCLINLVLQRAFSLTQPRNLGTCGF